ncbi:MAG TPA: PAS domain-containing protein [Hanamia sp.]|nr:PAS domain-containing protein [Hanamia sp.]
MNDLTYLPTRNDNYLAQSNGSESPDFEVIEKVKYTSTAGLYDAVFQNAFHAVYIENGDGLILKFNEKFCKLFGYSVSEMAEVENTDLFEMDENSFLNFMNERTDKGIAKGEITGIKKSGKTFPCRISSVIYQSDFGDKRAMNTLVDISDDLSARWNF